jgi:hypothetical protein
VLEHSQEQLARAGYAGSQTCGRCSCATLVSCSSPYDTCIRVYESQFAYAGRVDGFRADFLLSTNVSNLMNPRAAPGQRTSRGPRP